MNDYVVVKKEGSAFRMSDMKLVDVVHFEVQHTDGKIAWTGKSYYASAGARSIAGLKLAATNMAKRYQAHFDRTGQRFEVEEEKKRLAARIAKQSAARIERLKKEIPALQAELQAAERGARFDLARGKFVVET